MKNKEEIETIKRKARQLKQMVGTGLALDECESFIHSTISDYKQGQTLPIDSVSISNRVKMNYLESKYEVKWLKNDTYQVEQDGNCIYQDTEIGCNEYLKGLLGY